MSLWGMLRDMALRWNVPAGPSEYIISGIRKRARFLNLRTSSREPEVPETLGTVFLVGNKGAGAIRDPALAGQWRESRTQC